MALQVWMVGENGEALKNPKEFLPVSKLEEIGVLYWHLDPKKSESEEELSKIRKNRGYSYMDLLEICPGKLENYEEKLKNFFREHMHADEEIRYCLEGGGYFDVRNKDDKWIRIWIKEGDMIVLPAGIYHRFTLDTANHVKVADEIFSELMSYDTYWSSGLFLLFVVIRASLCPFGETSVLKKINSSL